MNWLIFAALILSGVAAAAPAPVTRVKVYVVLAHTQSSLGLASIDLDNGDVKFESGRTGRLLISGQARAVLAALNAIKAPPHNTTLIVEGVEGPWNWRTLHLTVQEP